MSGLRSALEEYRGEDLRGVSDEGLERDLGDLERASRQVEAERARRVAEVDRRGSFTRDGHLGVASWLAHRLRMAMPAAAWTLRMARALEEMPATREALAEGEVSVAAVRVLVEAREAHPRRFADVEATLLDAACTLTIRELRYAVKYWRQALDQEAAARDEEWKRDRRRLYLSPTIEGMVRVDGDLDPETGQTLISAIRAVVDAEARSSGEGDRRTSAQRRADALGEICRRYLDSSDRPLVAGERPHVTVTVGLEALEGRAEPPCELDDAGPVAPETARRWACDASISRVITRGRSEPLDVGRRTPVVPAALRRAVVVRDRRCRFPGCDRPHAWCDAHHVVHWADGGATALWNLVLLCRPHHRLLHRGFRVAMPDGVPRFSRPDGSPLEDRVEDRAPP